MGPAQCIIAYHHHHHHHHHHIHSTPFSIYLCPSIQCSIPFLCMPIYSMFPFHSIVHSIVRLLVHLFITLHIPAHLPFLKCHLFHLQALNASESLVIARDRSARRTKNAPKSEGCRYAGCNHTQIHGSGIFTYIWLIFMVNVGK